MNTSYSHRKDLESAGMIVGENTCDGKKKAYEPLNDLVENLYVNVL
jgi:benzoyl-CoA reductase/2-hydroxyglutaryl-CoA dehydratase subunit BcrC/BadD/HgdB